MPFPSPRIHSQLGDHKHTKDLQGIRHGPEIGANFFFSPRLTFFREMWLRVWLDQKVNRRIESRI